MKKYTIRFTKWVGIAWIVLAILVGCVAPASEETATVQPITATETMTAVTSSPTVTLPPTLSPTMATETPASELSIPSCTFVTDDVPEVAGPSLDDYVFSEPQVALTHTSAIGIAGWLPDGERLLITRQIPGQPREYVETFNTQTGELQRYGERHSFNAKPLWLATEKAAVFADTLAERRTVICFSHGNEISKSIVSEPLIPYLEVNPAGDKVLFFTKADQTKPKILNVTQLQSETLAFNLPLTPQRELPLGQSSGPDPYRTAWHPTESQIAFYNDTGFYLADLDTWQVCRVDLGEMPEFGTFWAFHAQWSPDGRYLAMLTTIGDLPFKFSNLAILDTATGELRSMHPRDLANLKQNYITDITWAPNSQVLATWLVVEEIAGTHKKGLYLVDAVTGLWAVDGGGNSQTAASCPPRPQPLRRRRGYSSLCHLPNQQLSFSEIGAIMCLEASSSPQANL